MYLALDLSFSQGIKSWKKKKGLELET
jgi:hypothetical protein